METAQEGVSDATRPGTRHRPGKGVAASAVLGATLYTAKSAGRDRLAVAPEG